MANASDPRMRVTFPAGGNAAEALTVIGGTPDRAVALKNELPAKEYSIVDDMLTISDSCAFTIDNSDGRNVGKIRLGQLVKIDEKDVGVAGGDWVPHFTGRVVAVESASDIRGGSVILVSCMDLGWHLNTCCAIPLKSLKGLTLQKLITLLIDPTWGFAASPTLGPTVTQGNSLNRALKQGRLGVSLSFIPPLQLQFIPIQVEPGQTPWGILQTYASRLGLLLNVGAKGDLILFQPEYRQQNLYQTIHYHGQHESDSQKNNVEGRPSFRQSIEGVYSQVQCWSTVVKPVTVESAEIAQNPNAQYRHDVYKPDSNPLPFNRLHVFSDGEAINQAMRKMRAQWKYQMDLFNSWEYTVTVKGHSSNGNYYTSDAVIAVADTINGVSGNCYIQSVRRSFTLSEGAMTQLTLRLPYLLNPALQAQQGTIAHPQPPVK